MKIGIWLNESINPSIGGGSSYVNRLLSLIDTYVFDNEIEICYVTVLPNNNFKRDVINVSQFPSYIYKLFSFSESIIKTIRKIDERIIRYRGLNKVLRDTDIKIMYYVQQLVIIDDKFPFISTNWDIGHRSTFTFPELIRNYGYRESYYQTILPKALMIICESETGKKELINYTRIGDFKIRIMPMFAGVVSSLCVPIEEMRFILKQNDLLKNNYFYYPAQFWAHKNHIGLLRAFKKFITQRNNSFKLVMSGSDKGNLLYVKSYAEKLGIMDNVLFLGFISEKEVYTLYKNATCLVMASHFGPTNMPPIEAMELGCPIACSDLGGHREILGDGGVYFNSLDDLSIYNSLVEIVDHRDYYVSKIIEQKGKTLFNSENAIKCLDKILHDAVNIRTNWK